MQKYWYAIVCAHIMYERLDIKSLGLIINKETAKSYLQPILARHLQETHTL